MLTIDYLAAVARDAVDAGYAARSGFVLLLDRRRIGLRLQFAQRRRWLLRLLLLGNWPGRKCAHFCRFRMAFTPRKTLQVWPSRAARRRLLRRRQGGGAQIGRAVVQAPRVASGIVIIVVVGIASRRRRRLLLLLLLLAIEAAVAEDGSRVGRGNDRSASDRLNHTLSLRDPGRFQIIPSSLLYIYYQDGGGGVCGGVGHRIADHYYMQIRSG